MQDLASVLPDRCFVQMAAGVQIKFKSSVARGMHPPLPASQTGTNKTSGGWRAPVKTVFAVDRA
jgi:hypothetical protein